MIHQFTTPLIAGIEEAIGAIVTLVALVFWIIQKISEANKAARPARQQPRPRADGGAADVGQPVGQQADPLRTQVEEFLRRANQGNQPNQGGAQPRRAGQPAREVELLVAEEAEPRQRRVVGAPLQSMTPHLAAQPPGTMAGDKRPERASIRPRKRKTLAERADERAAARTKSISQQASNLGQRIIAEDQQFDVQLRAKFDHTVGTLAETTELTPVERETPASQIAAMLANPDGVRQAIILNEILHRPSDRW